ncbi:MAG: hypothetical protein IKI54_00745, partial [Lachnospiraceae bacterium]|nr:hypothetical protein [Lachnospiraceae bacterium]
MPETSDLKAQMPKIEAAVYRRFSDFDNLRKLISKHFPSFYVPPLPNKKIGN